MPLCVLLELGWLMGMVISLRKSTTVGHGCNGIRVRAMEFPGKKYVAGNLYWKTTSIMQAELFSERSVRICQKHLRYLECGTQETGSFGRN